MGLMLAISAHVESVVMSSWLRCAVEDSRQTSRPEFCRVWELKQSMTTYYVVVLLALKTYFRHIAIYTVYLRIVSIVHVALFIILLFLSEVFGAEAAQAKKKHLSTYSSAQKLAI